MLHLGSDFYLSFCFSSGHGLLLLPHALLLFDDLLCLAFQVNKHFVFALNFFLLIDDFLSDPVLELNEVFGVPREALIDSALATHWQVVTNCAWEHACLKFLVKLLCHGPQLLERHSCLLIQEKREVLYASDLHELCLVAEQVGPEEVQKELRLLVSHEQMVDQFQPVFLLKSLSE